MRNEKRGTGVALSLVAAMLLVNLTLWILAAPAADGNGTRIRAALDAFETAVSDFVHSAEWVRDWATLFHCIDRLIQPLREAGRGA